MFGVNARMSAKKIPQSAARKQREEADILQANRTVLYLSFAIVAMLLLVFMDRCITSVQMLPVFRAINLALTVGFGFCLILSLYLFSSTKGGNTAGRVLQPEVALLLSTVGLLGMLFVRGFYSDGIKLLYVAVPALYVLYLIKLIYGNPFCCIASYLLGAGSLLYVLNRLLRIDLLASMQIPFGLLLSAAGVLFVAFCLRLRSRKGVLAWRGTKLKLFRWGDSYVPALLSGALTVFLGGLFTRSTAYALFYGIIALSAALVLLGLYYTYALMYR